MKKSSLNRLILISDLAGMTVDRHEMEYRAVKRPQPERKLTRNQPCPCKSGKKYKFCCSGGE